MRDYGTLDLETDPFSRPDPRKPGRIPEAFASGFYDGKKVTLFWGDSCVADVMAYLMKHCQDWLIYAHNGGKFDFHFLLQYILRYFSPDDLELMAIGSRLVKIKTPVFELRDSFSLIPKPLRGIVGANKGEIDFAKLEKEVRNQHKDEINRYLSQDCVGLYDGLGEFFSRYGCEITLASTTFKVLKKDFEVKPIRTNLAYDDKFREFYFAGRVQFFSLGKHGEKDGKKRFSICDINSAFPWAMLSRHWFGGEYIRLDNPPKKFREQSFYEIECDADGCLPFREENGGVSFPHVKGGRFFATGWELFAGIELGLIRNVKYRACYMPTECIDFAGYVNHFYEMKKNATNPADRDFAKLFLNSCYGKFGADCRTHRDIKITKWGEIPDAAIIETKDEKEISVEWEHSYDDLKRGLSFWQMPSNHPESKIPMTFYNVCTAASITGCVRAFLARSIAKCKGVLYCDTDSIIATDTSALTLGDELGAWKLEAECDAVWLGGKKLYAAHFAQKDASKKGEKAEWKKASKGVRLSVDDLVAVCEGEERTYHFEAPNYSVFSGISFTSRRVNRDDKRKNKKPKSENESDKHRNNGAKSRTVIPNGFAMFRRRQAASVG